MSDPVAMAWPKGGAVRLHYDPGALPSLGDQPGANRFDDPRPRTFDRFLMRYAATSLRGCLLELLARFRHNDEAAAREEAVDTNDPELVDPPVVEDWQHIADFVANRKVGTLHVREPMIVSINDPVVQHALDREPAVRAVLDSVDARAALLEEKGQRVHLDNAAIRLSSPVGRYLTQACALALYDREPHPDVIHYRSRHDDAENCWAIYHYADVKVSDVEEFTAAVDEHRKAMRCVADLWDLPLPPEWQ